MRIWPGRPYPLGATWDGAGVNFALFSEHATKVELCLFDSPDATKESQRITLPEQTDQVWHGYLPDVQPGQLYGYRVHGPYEPAKGHRFNPNKVVLDPYAKAIGRDAAVGRRAVRLHARRRRGRPVVRRPRQRRRSPRWPRSSTPRSPGATTGRRARPGTRRSSTSCTSRASPSCIPDVPEKLRGTYAGLASEAAIQHLHDLGVTAVELLPVHHHVDDRHLVEKGLTQLLGLQHARLLRPGPALRVDARPARARCSEFKTMVRALHAAGIEVILDVVYNHTAEGNQLGPTLSLRGIDNASYYRLSPEDPRYYMDFTGCGNTLNMQHPRVLQLIMDSLRYWVTGDARRRLPLRPRQHAGPRAVRGRQAGRVLRHHPPGPGAVAGQADRRAVGRRPGRLPGRQLPRRCWTEWNGKYRDSVRRFWKGDGGTASRVRHAAVRLAATCTSGAAASRTPASTSSPATTASRCTTSSATTTSTTRPTARTTATAPTTTTAGTAASKGPTDDPAIIALRERQKRNLIATLLLSQGVPMLLAGDELGHTQNGNNNAYCQDNELTWLDWELDDEQQEFLEFVRKVTPHLARAAGLQRRKFFQGRAHPRLGHQGHLLVRARPARR